MATTFSRKLLMSPVARGFAMWIIFEAGLYTGYIMKFGFNY